MSARRFAHRRRARRSSGLNLLIAIDKPYGMVTRAVDNAVANALEDDGVGHIGTLDPAVTGVVVIAIGQAKKLISSIEDGKRKSYSATITFGRETDTDDAEGTTTREAAVPASLSDVPYATQVLSSFTGDQKQRPPRYSAIKVNGVRAYDMARAGEDFELPERDIHVYDATLSHIEAGNGTVSWHCDFTVSVGTYIRALARDIGRAVGSAAYLGSLCRTASGAVALSDCITLETVRDLGKERINEIALDPVAVLGLPTYPLSEGELHHVQNGRAFTPREEQIPEGEAVSLIRGNKLYGIWTARGGCLRSRVNCPEGVEGVR